MGLSWISKTYQRFLEGESGVTLIESVVALALMGALGVVLLSGIATTSKAVIITDEQATGESLARSQIESAEQAAYLYGATAYTAAPIPDGQDYAGYSTVISATPLHTPDDGIQKITVTISRYVKEIIKLEGYKVDR